MKTNIAMTAALLLTACALTPREAAAPSAQSAEVSAQCAQLREEINKAAVARRDASAGASSSFPVIAEAAQARQEQSVELARQRYADLGCKDATAR